MADGSVAVPSSGFSGSINIADLLKFLMGQTQTSAGSSSGVQTGTTASTIDPAVKENLDKVIGTLLGQMNDSGQKGGAVQGVIDNILQQGAKAFLPTGAQQNAAGVNNSTSDLLLRSDALSTASAKAAAAVLQAQQQAAQTASSTLTKVADTTKATTTGQTAQTDTKQTQTTAPGSAGGILGGNTGSVLQALLLGSAVSYAGKKLWPAVEGTVASGGSKLLQALGIGDFAGAATGAEGAIGGASFSTDGGVSLGDLGGGAAQDTVSNFSSNAAVLDANAPTISAAPASVATEPLTLLSDGGQADAAGAGLSQATSAEPILDAGASEAVNGGLGPAMDSATGASVADLVGGGAVDTVPAGGASFSSGAVDATAAPAALDLVGGGSVDAVPAGGASFSTGSTAVADAASAAPTAGAGIADLVGGAGGGAEGAVGGASFSTGSAAAGAEAGSGLLSMAGWGPAAATAAALVGVMKALSGESGSNAPRTPQDARALAVNYAKEMSMGGTVDDAEAIVNHAYGEGLGGFENYKMGDRYNIEPTRLAASAKALGSYSINSFDNPFAWSLGEQVNFGGGA